MPRNYFTPAWKLILFFIIHLKLCVLLICFYCFKRINAFECWIYRFLCHKQKRNDNIISFISLHCSCSARIIIYSTGMNYQIIILFKNNVHWPLITLIFWYWFFLLHSTINILTNNISIKYQNIRLSFYKFILRILMQNI